MCAHSSAHHTRIAPDEIVDEALEVRRLRDVHRRARGLHHVARRAHAVAPGPKEFIEYVVLVRGDDEPRDREPHHPRHVARAHVAEIARRHGEGDLLVVRRRDRKIALEVVHDLGDEPCPVDGVDGTDMVPRLEREVVRHGLHHVLAVVEYAAHGDVEDVGVRQRIHLRGLERAHLACRRQHEDPHPALTLHRILRRRARVAGGGAEDVQLLAAPTQHVFEERAEQLHRDVLEREGWPVGQVQQVQARLQRTDRRDRLRPEGFGRVRAIQDVAQILGGNIVDEPREDLEGELAITERAPGCEVDRRHPRIAFGHRETAVGGETAEENVGEGRGRHAAAGGDVSQATASRSTLPSGSASRHLRSWAVSRCARSQRSRASRASRG